MLRLCDAYRFGGCLCRFEFPYAATPVSQDLWAAISRAIATSNPQIEHTIPQPWTTASDFLDESRGPILEAARW